jgi:predicted TIM-barrel fold metal-dependent hydrolase
MAEFQIVDANAAIGSHPSHKLNMTVERLMRDMNAGKIASSLIQSTHGIYDRHERGNSIVLESARANNRLIPIATINPLMFFGINQDIENLHSAGFRIFKFYPSHQNWDLESAVFSHIVKQLSSMNIPIMIDTPETGQPTKALRAAENYESTIILCSISLDTLSESLALMEDYPNVMIETHKLHVPGALEMITEKVGADRIVFGSGAPLRSLASSLSYIVCSNLPDDARQQILSRNILRVMGANG